MNERLPNGKPSSAPGAGRSGWRRPASGILCLMLFAAGSASASTGTERAHDRHLYLGNCAGDVHQLDLDPPALRTSHSITDLVPTPPKAPAICMLESLSIASLPDAPRALEIEVLAEDFPDPADNTYRTVLVSPRDWKLLSAAETVHAWPHEARPSAWLGDLLMKALQAGKGEDLRRYVHFRAGPEKPSLAANEVAFTADFGLAQLRERVADTTDFALLRLSTGQVTVVAGAPRSFATYMRLSPAGRRVLVEEVRGPAEQKESLRRTGRIAVFDSDTGRRTLDTVLPVLREPGVRILCISDQGTPVLASAKRGRIWILSGGHLHEFTVPNDFLTSCVFD